MTCEHIALGLCGEKKVIYYLEREGYTIITHNFVYHPKLGEIDIIAKKDDVIAFIEVKTRRNHFAPLEYIVNKKKQNNIIRTAEFFIIKESIDIDVFVIRFDIAYVLSDEITYYENAFCKE